MAARRRGMHQQRGRYREQTWAPLWVMVLIWVSCGAAIVGSVHSIGEALSATGDQGLSWPGIGALAAVGVAAFFLLAINAFFIRLDVEVRADHIHIAFGPIHLVRKRIPFKDIEDVRGLTYRPLLEFGGWGIRPRPKRTAWTIRGNQAAAVKLRSGRQIYVGSEHPQRLAGAIRTAMRGVG